MNDEVETEKVDRLKRWLTASGVSQAELAREMGLSGQSITYYLNGQRRIRDEFLDRAIPFLKQKAIERLGDISEILKEDGG